MFLSLLHKAHDQQLYLSRVNDRLCFCNAGDVVVRDFL